MTIQIKAKSEEDAKKLTTNIIKDFRKIKDVTKTKFKALRNMSGRGYPIKLPEIRGEWM